METMPPCPTSNTSFFKVILSSTFHNGKLKVPTKFVKYNGDELAECVSFSVPTGHSWNVRIQRENDGSIWFRDGLIRFMEDNSVGIEFFLVFEYIGGSKFSVLIFDLTATEIQYNCSNALAASDVNQMPNADIRESDDDSIECLGPSVGHLFPQKSAEPSKSGSSDNREKCFLHESNNIKRCYFTRGKKQMLEEGIAVDGGKRSLKYKGKKERDGGSISKRECGDERTVQAKNWSFSTSFKVTLKSYNINKQFLVFPCEFANLNMPHSTQLIKLLDSDDNEWVVRFTYNTRTRYLASGWGCFVKDKELKAGDVCVFERVRGYQVKLKVNIHRSAKARAIKSKNKLAPNFFKVTLTPSYINNGFVNVPSKFAPLLGSHNSARLIKLVDVDDNEWMVRYIDRHKHILSKGWTHFVRDKKLMVGDVCTFERVRGAEVKMKVAISSRIK